MIPENQETPITKYKKTEMSDHFCKDCFLDARDSVNEWKVG